MPIRDDKQAGSFVLAAGVLMCLFSSFGLLMVTLQRAMLASRLSAPSSSTRAAVLAVFLELHRVWLLYLPLTFLGGLVFAVTGRFIMSGSPRARLLAKANAVGGYIWNVAYMISVSGIVDKMMALSSGTPESIRMVVKVFAYVSGSAIGFGIPTALLYVLRPIRGNSVELTSGSSGTDENNI